MTHNRTSAPARFSPGGLGRSVWVLFLTVILAITALSAGDAEAKRKKKPKRAKTVYVTSKDHIKALQEFMGAFKFGMSQKDVLEVVSKQIGERYAEQVSNTNDVYRQDELRRKRDEEIKRVGKSIVEFKGERSGWDVSIIDDQFAHNTEETMLVYWENFQGRNQRRFFFFFRDQLYKMFIALDTTALQLRDDQKNFAFFRQLMENRFGPGQESEQGVTWQARSFRVDAVDRLGFYNAFCLVIADPKLSKELFALREERKQAPKPRNAIIEAVTAGDNDQSPALDEGSGVIDDIIKKNNKTPKK